MRFSREKIEDIIRYGNAEQIKLLQTYLNSPYYSFDPRPDDPIRGDQQESFYEDKFDGVAVLLGGEGSGKTYVAAQKVARLVQHGIEPPEGRTPFIIVCRNLQMVGNLWVQYLQYLIDPRVIEKTSWQDSTDGYPRSVVLKKKPNGNRWVLQFKSAEQGFEAFNSVNFGGFWIDEPVKWEIYTQIHRGTRKYQHPGSCIWSMTPKYIDLPELKEKFDNRENEEHWKFYRLNTELNWHLPKGWVEKTKASNPPSSWGTILYGDFQHLAGACLPEWDVKKHVIAPNQLPADFDKWDRFRAIDPGGSEEHLTAIVFVARSPDKNRWIIYHEMGFTVEPTAEIIASLKKVPAWIWDEQNRHCVATYSDPENGRFRVDLSAAGISTQIAKKDRMESLEYIRSLLLPLESGEVGLQVVDSCKKTIQQFAGWHWIKGSKRASAKPKLEWAKVDDDFLDAARYALFTPAARDIKPWTITTAKPAWTKPSIFGRV